MITPRSSTRYISPWMRPMPIGCRSEITTSTVDGSDRRSAASRTQGDASSRLRQRVEIGPDQALAAQAGQHGEHLALRQPLVPAHEDAFRPAARAHARRQSTRDSRRTRRRPRGRRSRRHGLARSSQSRRLRPGLTCARRNRLSAAGAATGLMHGFAPFGAEAAVRARHGRGPQSTDPARCRSNRPRA